MLKPVLSFAVALGAAIGAAQAAEPKFSFKMTTLEREGTDTWRLFPQQFTEKVRIATGGAVEVKAYGAGVLAGIFEGHKAVKDGRADLAYHYPAFEVNENPAASFISDLPGGMGSDTKLMWLYSGGGLELWKEFRHSQGLHGIFCAQTGSELFANSHKKVQTLADLKGYKYRTAGANTDVMKALGAAPAIVPGPDVFPMLERKGIDGAEYLDPSRNLSLGFHKIAKYVIYPGIHAPGGIYEVTMKKETWDAFPQNIQQILDMVCDSVVIRGYAYLNHHNADAMRQMAENPNNELVELSPEVIKAFRKAGRDWVDEKIKTENAKGNMWMEKFAKSYYGFMDMWSKYSRYQVVDRD